MFRRCAILAAFAAHAAWAGWWLAANPHFEVYSSAGGENARASVEWLERLRAWLIRETGLRPDRLRPARVIGFATAAEYAPFRLRETADAYYIGTESRDYMVLVLGGARAHGVAAHEYAHMALHSAGLKLPPWLGEGLADVFAGAAEGGPEAGHRSALRRSAWIPVGELLRITAEERERRSAEANSLFYAESWALASLLVSSREYAGKLPLFVAAVSAGTAGETALATVYGKTPSRAEADLRQWLEHGVAIAPLAPPAVNGPAAPAVEVAPDRMRRLIATLLLDSGEVGRAEAVFREEPADNGDAQAALGLIAHYAGRYDEARERWRRAVALGTEDDALCFRYAMLAENAGAPAEELRAVLARAVAIRPEFDDARFRLALLEKNAEHFDEAIAQLRAMRRIAPERAFAYWSAMSDALNATGKFREAEAAANTALGHAATAQERTQAAEQAHIARTEIVVQMQPDGSGKPRMVAVRAPRGATDWNPFIQAGDDVRRATGVLTEIVCGEGPTRFVVEIGGVAVALSIPDPARVQMIRAPDEFTCGRQDRRSVAVVYAARVDGGTLRGIEFQ